MNRIVLFGSLLLCLGCVEGIVAQEPVYTYVLAGDSISSNVPLNEINTKAFRHFEEDYGHVSQQDWRKYKDGYSVTFMTQDSALYHVFYSMHGAAGNVHVYYTAAATPAEVMDRLNVEYKGCPVLYGAESIDRQRTVFEVGLLVKNKLRIVQVREGDIKVIHEYDVYAAAPR
jgi:hypothetical protein